MFVLWKTVTELTELDQILVANRDIRNSSSDCNMSVRRTLFAAQKMKE